MLLPLLSLLDEEDEEADSRRDNGGRNGSELCGDGDSERQCSGFRVARLAEGGREHAADGAGRGRRARRERGRRAGWRVAYSDRRDEEIRSPPLLLVVLPVRAGRRGIQLRPSRQCGQRRRLDAVLLVGVTSRGGSQSEL